jgi:hypothetical protein
MSLFRTGTLVLALMCISSAVFAECGPCTSPGCAESCSLCCQQECKTEKLKRHCYKTECKPICIPPVTLPCCRLSRCFGGSASDGCCDDDCRNSGLLQKLCSKLTACRIRHVNTYKKVEYDCGTKCVCKWKVVPCAAGCCDQGCCETGAHCTSR